MKKIIAWEEEKMEDRMMRMLLEVEARILEFLLPHRRPLTHHVPRTGITVRVEPSYNKKRRY
jgi:hypothetical protein